MSEIISVTIPVIATAITIFMTVIAYFQYKTNRDKFILDLFSRRLELYDNFCSAHSNIVETAEISNVTLGLLVSARNSSRFLFGREVCLFITDFLKTAEEYRRLENSLRNETVIPKVIRGEYTEACDKMLIKMANSGGRFVDIVEPYLKMDQKITQEVTLKCILDKILYRGRAPVQ